MAGGQLLGNDQRAPVVFERALAVAAVLQHVGYSVEAHRHVALPVGVVRVGLGEAGGDCSGLAVLRHRRTGVSTRVVNVAQADPCPEMIARVRLAGTQRKHTNIGSFAVWNIACFHLKIAQPELGLNIVGIERRRLCVGFVRALGVGKTGDAAKGPVRFGRLFRVILDARFFLLGDGAQQRRSLSRLVGGQQAERLGKARVRSRAAGDGFDRFGTALRGVWTSRPT